MGNSLWNRSASIPIADLSESELKEAMKEWAEGNQYLEDLLWQCYQNGVVTMGCDAGEHHPPYLQLDIAASSEKLKNVLSAAWKFGDTELFLKFVGNPFSGPDWHKSTVSVSPLWALDSSSFFNYLAGALNNSAEVSKNNAFVDSLAFYEFLKDKESDLSIRLVKKHTEYSITVDCFCNHSNWDYFTELFEEVGLTKVHKDGSPVIKWTYKCGEEEEFNFVVKRLLGLLTTKWSLSLPDEINSDMSFSAAALVMRRKFGTDPDGVKRMNEWLNTKKPEGTPEINY